MTFHVELTKTAEREVQQILSWIADRSPGGAIAWYDAWEAAIVFLSSNPYATSLALESIDHEEEIRQWSFKTTHGLRYRALFLIRNETVFITNVRGHGQRRVRKEEIGKEE